MFRESAALLLACLLLARQSSLPLDATAGAQMLRADVNILAGGVDSAGFILGSFLSSPELRGRKPARHQANDE